MPPGRAKLIAVHPNGRLMLGLFVADDDDDGLSWSSSETAAMAAAPVDEFGAK